MNTTDAIHFHIQESHIKYPSGFHHRFSIGKANIFRLFQFLLFKIILKTLQHFFTEVLVIITYSNSHFYSPSPLFVIHQQNHHMKTFRLFIIMITYFSLIMFGRTLNTLYSYPMQLAIILP